MLPTGVSELEGVTEAQGRQCWGRGAQQGQEHRCTPGAALVQ